MTDWLRLSKDKDDLEERLKQAEEECQKMRIESENIKNVKKKLRNWERAVKREGAIILLLF